MAWGASGAHAPGIKQPKLPKMTSPGEAGKMIAPKGMGSLKRAYRDAIALRLHGLNMGLPSAVIKKFGFSTQKSYELPGE